jgi:hypothetical protein
MLGEGMLPPVVVQLKGDIAQFQAKMAEARGEVDSFQEGAGGKLAMMQNMAKVGLFAIGAAAIGVGTSSVKMAGDFQESMTQLVTGAGESKANIKMVGDGILQMAGQVGQSTTLLAQGMYMIESAGYHGAAGLSVLKAAAEGARVGNADLGTTANALTTVMRCHVGSDSHRCQWQDAPSGLGFIPG